MRTLIITLLVFCTAILGAPSSAWAVQSTPPAPTADKAAAATPEEQAQLAQLSSQDPSLLKQSAGDRVVVVERGGGWRRGPRYGYGIGAVVLAVVLVTLLVVVAAQPTYYRR